MPQRWFIAIPLDEAHKQAFAEFRKHNATAFRHIPQVKKVRWVPWENLHITSLFLGDIEEEEQQLVRNAIRTTADSLPGFRLHFDRYMFAPKPQKPRMIWGRFQQNNAFVQLHEALQASIRNTINCRKEDKEPIPHTTLARFTPFRNNNQVQLRSRQSLDQPLQADHCELWASELHPDGAKYTVIEEFPFQRETV